MNSKYLGYRLAQWFSTHLNSSVSFRLAETIADWQWHRAHEERQALCANLSLALNRPVSVDDPLVREVFRNFARYLVEFFAIQRIEHPDVCLEGIEHLHHALERAGCAIILTGHLGNWELGAVLLRRMGFSVTAVALPHDEPRMDRLFNRQRQRCGLHVIPVGRHGARSSLQSLRRGELLGLLGDHDFIGDGVTVSFSERDVSFPRGPATLSLRSHAPAIPTFCMREGPWKFRLCFEPPLWPQTQLPNTVAIHLLTQAYATVFERYLKRYPDQWLMFQPIALSPVDDTHQVSASVLVPESQ